VNRRSPKIANILVQSDHYSRDAAIHFAMAAADVTIHGYGSVASSACPVDRSALACAWPGFSARKLRCTDAATRGANPPGD
jgi:hypothetical protein